VQFFPIVRRDAIVSYSVGFSPRIRDAAIVGEKPTLESGKTPTIRARATRGEKPTLRVI
jgi:hypothetical protein